MARALPAFPPFDPLCYLLFSDSPPAETIRRVSTCGNNRREIGQLCVFLVEFRRPLADSEKPAEMALRESVRSGGNTRKTRVPPANLVLNPCLLPRLRPSAPHSSPRNNQFCGTQCPRPPTPPPCASSSRATGRFRGGIPATSAAAARRKETVSHPLRRTHSLGNRVAYLVVMPHIPGINGLRLGQQRAVRQ